MSRTFWANGNFWHFCLTPGTPVTLAFNTRWIWQLLHSALRVPNSCFCRDNRQIVDRHSVLSTIKTKGLIAATTASSTMTAEHCRDEFIVTKCNRTPRRRGTRAVRTCLHMFASLQFKDTSHSSDWCVQAKNRRYDFPPGVVEQIIMLTCEDRPMAALLMAHSCGTLPCQKYTVQMTSSVSSIQRLFVQTVSAAAQCAGVIVVYTRHDA